MVLPSLVLGNRRNLHNFALLTAVRQEKNCRKIAVPAFFFVAMVRLDAGIDAEGPKWDQL
jgi:hypothetical protein